MNYMDYAFSKLDVIPSLVRVQLISHSPLVRSLQGISLEGSPD